MNAAPTQDVTAGSRHTREDYQGTGETFKKMAIKIREASRDPKMLPAFQQFAERIIRESGVGVNDRRLSNQRAAQIFLDYMRQNVRYRHDPPMVEFIKGAHITLCVPGAAACIPVGDCDDLVVAYCSLCMAYGIEARVTVQDFGKNEDLHVIAEIKDDDGDWVPADPSHPNSPVGKKLLAVQEMHFDPLEPDDLGLKNAPAAEFVSVGALPRQVGQVPTVDSSTPSTSSGISTGGWIAIGLVGAVAIGGGIFACARYSGSGRRAPPSVRKFAKEAMAGQRLARGLGG